MTEDPSLAPSSLPPPLTVTRVSIVLNSGAGASHQHIQPDDLVAAFARHGVQADVAVVGGKRLRAAATAALERATRQEIDVLVVGGGDGSIRTVASVLADTATPLGVIPLGTLNHFAKDLGIPLTVEAATEAIAKGRRRVVDLAEVNGETFINNSSIGIYPYLVIDRERRQARYKLAKWMAMVPAFMRMLRHFPRRRLRICAEGFNIPYRTPCLFVGNNEYGIDLFTLGRRKQLDSGKLWVYVVKPRNPLGFFWMVCRMCFGRLDQGRDLETFRLDAAEISAKSTRLPVALDGEVKMLRPPLRYRARPRALTVMVPQWNGG